MVLGSWPLYQWPHQSNTLKDGAGRKQPDLHLCYCCKSGIYRAAAIAGSPGLHWNASLRLTSRGPCNFSKTSPKQELVCCPHPSPLWFLTIILGPIREFLLYSNYQVSVENSYEIPLNSRVAVKQLYLRTTESQSSAGISRGYHDKRKKKKG